MTTAYITTIDNKSSNQVDNLLTIPSLMELPSVESTRRSYVVANAMDEIFSEVKKIIRNITNKTVQEQAINVLHQIAYCLRQHGINAMSRRFTKLFASESEDGSCLIEWNFKNFRIGISLEPHREKSYYFLVSMDESIGEINTKTRRINGELNIVIETIVQFIITNT